jgi:hypothetical protein
MLRDRPAASAAKEADTDPASAAAALEPADR